MREKTAYSARKRSPKRSPKLSKDHPQKGQISIMIAIMMTTFILFFAFVVNTGMLVNAKINLQNAADLAAYAGAATQARQLNSISYINYEMRRQWKKFLFRVYVLGNMAGDGFPRSASGNGKTPYDYIFKNGVPGYKVPVTCITFNPANDNHCHMDTLPSISIPAKNPLDVITSTLNEQLTALEEIRQNSCKAMGQTNKMVNIYWLFNSDPTLSQLNPAGNLTMDQQNILKTIRVLSQGLGIIPREIILKMRIKTLNDYVNAPAQQGLTKPALETLLKDPDPSLYERTAQAFYSAYYTLGNHTFAADTIFLDELLPAGVSNNSNLLMLKDIKTEEGFDTYTIDLALRSSNGTVHPVGTTNLGSADCISSIIPVSIQTPVPLGVYKDPTVLTYYAIRLRATAKLLFSPFPFGALELKAYAAARPFGSRIGPQNAQFTSKDSSLSSNQYINQGIKPPPTFSSIIPNLPVRDEDSNTRGSGWDTQEVLGAMYTHLITATRGVQTANTINAEALDSAYQAAMAPNPWEANRYNIISDLGPDNFTVHFDAIKEGKTVFWAPIISPSKQGALVDEVKGQIKQILDNVQGGGNLGFQGNFQSNMANLSTAIQQGLTTYITTKLTQPVGGEDGETINLFTMRNPFWRMNGSTHRKEAIGGSAAFFLPMDPTKVKTSWNFGNDRSFHLRGRVGYSVKFVSFNSLPNGGSQGSGGTGGNTWINSIWRDPDVDQDLPEIKH